MIGRMCVISRVAACVLVGLLAFGGVPAHAFADEMAVSESPSEIVQMTEDKTVELAPQEDSGARAEVVTPESTSTASEEVAAVEETPSDGAGVGTVEAESDSYEDEILDLEIYVNMRFDSDGWYDSGPLCYGGTLAVTIINDGFSKVRGADVTVTVMGKTYTKSTDGSGTAEFAMPTKAKVGTAVKVFCSYKGCSMTRNITIKGAEKAYSFYDAYVDTHGDDPSWDYREKFNQNILIKPTYASSKQTKVIVKQATKGDVIKLKIGKKTYSKKIGKSVWSKTLTFKHPATAAGTKLTVVQYNRHRQKMGTAKSLVFSGKKLKKGLTKKQVRLLRNYGTPDGSSNMYGGWYRYESLYIYFRNGRVIGWTDG